MAAPSTVTAVSGYVLIGDTLSNRDHITTLVAQIRAENEHLPEDKQIHYLVCTDYTELAVTLRKHRDQIRLVLVGPGLKGKQDMVVRLMGGDIQTVMVLDPSRPLADKPEIARRLIQSIASLGVVMVKADDLPDEFYEPLVREHVVAGLSSKLDVASLSPEQRTELLETRLESVTMFPTLPETQRRVGALDDMDHPKKWAEAIEPDVPLKRVILNLLNSAHYSFRTRIKTVEQAVSLASARTIREVVLACTVQRLFKKVPEARVDEFWKHSVAAGFFAKLFALDADPETKNRQDKTELGRFGLDEFTMGLLGELELWKSFDIAGGATDAFTAGLLHDIGKVTMALCLEDSLMLLEPVIESGSKEAEAEGNLWAQSSKSIERSLMKDMDHEIIGGRIARRWGLDTSVQDVVRGHHQVRRASSDLVKLVALADIAANTILTYPITPDVHPLPKIMKRFGSAVDGPEASEEIWKASAEAYQIVEADVEHVLNGLEVSESLWKLIDKATFFRLCFLLGPRMRGLTTSFLQMTAASKAK